MNTEKVGVIAPESEDLINKVYPETDAGKLQEWLAGSAHEQELMGELEKNTHDVKNAGISRLGILVEACANYYFRTVFDRDDRLTADTRTKLGLEILENVAKEALPEGADESEVKAKMAEIYNEGVEEVELAEGVNVFQIKEPTSTDLAEAVEKVVKDWVSTGSLQARVEQLQQQLGKPETETWADEKKQAAKDKFAKIHEPQRKKIDSLAEALIDVDERETVEFLSNLPVWKLQYDLLETKNAAALKILLAGQKLGGQPIDGQTELIGSLEEVLKMRKPANQPDKLLETSRFFGSLSDIVRWRREIISQRQKTEAEINDYVKRLGLRMAWGNELEAVKVEEALTDYRTKASDLETAFPAVDLKAIGEESNLEAVELSLDPGWRVGRTKLKLRTIESKEKMARITAALPLLIEYKQFKLAGDYTIKQEGEKIWLYSENTRIGMVNASGTGEVELEWIEGLPVQSSLQATSALAAGLLEFIFKEEGRFPVFSLAARELESQPAEPATAEPAEPEAEEEEIPDWLRELQAGEEAAEAEEAEPLEIAAEVPEPPVSPPAPVEPEVPKRPVKIVSQEYPTQLAEAIKAGNGLADIQFDSSVLKTIVGQTLDRIAKQEINIRGLTITVAEITNWQVDNGLGIAFTAKGKYGVFPVSASVSCRLDEQFHLIGKPYINLPKITPNKDEAIETITSHLRQILPKITETIADQMKGTGVEQASMENATIKDQELFATFRGRGLEK